ncbi:MAG: hypothetical protein ACLQG5_01495 [Methanobacterium sp.]
MKLSPTAYRFQSGHRIRFQVSSVHSHDGTVT